MRQLPTRDAAVPLLVNVGWHDLIFLHFAFFLFFLYSSDDELEEAEGN